MRRAALEYHWSGRIFECHPRGHTAIS
ncbi:hypothetical protein [Shewanella pealeana]